MQRLPWTANHGSEQPCRIIVYDTETESGDIPNDPGRVAHWLRLGVAALYIREGKQWHERERLEFYYVGTFHEFVARHSRQREPLWVYAHNAAFDATIVRLWDEIDSDRLKIVAEGRKYRDANNGAQRQARPWIGRLAVDNIPFIVETISPRGLVRWCDTLNYIPLPLDILATWVGMAKIPLPKSDSDEGDWLARCHRDVDITAAVLFKIMHLWSDEQLGTWQPTIARLAYSAFRHLTPNSGIVAHGDEHDSADTLQDYWIRKEAFPLDAYDVSQIERRSYYGGRTRVGFVGHVLPDSDAAKLGGIFATGDTSPAINGPVTVFDVNGLYAYVMAECEFPVELMDALINPSLGKASSLVTQFPCIADVTVNTTTHEYPVRIEGRTTYVRGHYKTTLAGPELCRAVGRGQIETFHNLCVYYGGHPFRDFTRYWWEKRVHAIGEGDSTTAKLCKLVINSLYGKLGQRKPKWETVADFTPPRRWGGFVADREDGRGWRKFRVVAGTAQEEGSRKDCRHTFTAAAAFVTAYGRVYMDTLQSMLPKRSVIYQDTDSLFVLPTAVEYLTRHGMIHPTECGKLKDEGTYAHVETYGAKNYVLDGVPTVAGLRSKSVEVSPRSWLQTYFERCNSLIARQPDGTVHTWQQLFTPRAATPGFSVGPDGWTVPINYRG